MLQGSHSATALQPTGFCPAHYMFLVHVCPAALQAAAVLQAVACPEACCWKLVGGSAHRLSANVNAACKRPLTSTLQNLRTKQDNGLHKRQAGTFGNLAATDGVKSSLSRLLLMHAPWLRLLCKKFFSDAILTRDTVSAEAVCRFTVCTVIRCLIPRCREGCGFFWYATMQGCKDEADCSNERCSSVRCEGAGGRKRPSQPLSNPLKQIE